MRTDHTIWVEKYRPDTLDGYIGNEHVIEKVKQYIAENDISNICLCGGPGTGKTTISKIIVNSINCDYLYINASDENGIEVIRTKIKNFASTIGFNDLKIIILDESDHLSAQAMASLRATLEIFSKHTRFIFTCNYIERLIDPIKSRLQVFELTAPHKNIVYKHVVGILLKEGVTYNKEDLVNIINAEYPDIRKIIQTCQLYTNNNELRLDKQSLIASNYILQIIEVLKNLKKYKKNTDAIKEIRQIIADSKVKRFETLIRYLYDNIDDYCSEDKMLGVILLVADAQYQAAFTVDAEINIISMFVKLIDVLKSNVA